MLQGWLRIARAVNSDPVVSNRVFYDVLNEPDAFGVRFEPVNGRPGMKDLYFLAFDAIYSVNPSAPVLACPAAYLHTTSFASRSNQQRRHQGRLHLCLLLPSPKRNATLSLMSQTLQVRCS